MKKVLAMLLVCLMLIGSAVAEFDREIFELFGYAYNTGTFERKPPFQPSTLITKPIIGRAENVALDVGIIYDTENDCYFSFFTPIVVWPDQNSHNPYLMKIDTDGSEFEYSFFLEIAKIMPRETAGKKYTTAVCAAPFGSVMEEAIREAVAASLEDTPRKTTVTIFCDNEPSIVFRMTEIQLDVIINTYDHYLKAGGNKGLQFIATEHYANARKIPVLAPVSLDPFSEDKYSMDVDKAMILTRNPIYDTTVVCESGNGITCNVSSYVNFIPEADFSRMFLEFSIEYAPQAVGEIWSIDIYVENNGQKTHYGVIPLWKESIVQNGGPQSIFQYAYIPVGSVLEEALLEMYSNRITYDDPRTTIQFVGEDKEGRETIDSFSLNNDQIDQVFRMYIDFKRAGGLREKELQFTELETIVYKSAKDETR